MSVFKNWGEKEVVAWRAQQNIQRSYQEEVLNKLDVLESGFEVLEYGQLNYSTLDSRFSTYRLKALKNRESTQNKPAVLITGGVHGYETSGVQGAIRFCEFLCSDSGKTYLKDFNFVILPCLSPWAYETINRWNPHALDPNRSFFPESDVQKHAEESRLAQSFILASANNYVAHFDLHETTNTDNTVFRPALAARDGIEQDKWDIPDGFYVVGDSLRRSDSFQNAIIERVKPVTQIAPSDDAGNIIGAPAEQEGVIYFDVKRSGLCIGVTEAPYVTTTEMYPDSPKVTSEQCVEAQLAAILGGLEAIFDT